MKWHTYSYIIRNKETLIALLEEGNIIEIKHLSGFWFEFPFEFEKQGEQFQINRVHVITCYGTVVHLSNYWNNRNMTLKELREILGNKMSEEEKTQIKIENGDFT